MKHSLTPPPLTDMHLDRYDPRRVEGDWDKESAELDLRKNAAAIGEMAYRLYAEDRRALLLVLQGMDTAGKDGTIRAVLSDVNPQGLAITSFKAPSSEELAHDFLWRIHKAVPQRGMIGVFNRSHYEDVLIVRVHGLVPEKEWKSRYARINYFEKILIEGDVVLVKCYLHISKDEQRERLQARLDDPNKRWKFNPADLEERNRWDDYWRAAEDMLTKCNTEHAPWHIVPSDRKWYRNLVVSQLVRETLEKMDPKFPKEHEGLEGVVVE
jgi:PPK2 family polyphosphate:nucleotide phosphotransferase